MPAAAAAIEKQHKIIIRATAQQEVAVAAVAAPEGQRSKQVHFGPRWTTREAIDSIKAVERAYNPFPKHEDKDET